MIQEQKIDYPNNSPIKVTFLSVKNYSPHYHFDDIEIIYCFRGIITVISAFESFTLSAGEYYTTSRRDIHSIRASSGSGTGNMDNIIMLVHLDLTALSVPYNDLKCTLFVFETTSTSTAFKPNEPLGKINDILMLIGLLAVEEIPIITSEEPQYEKLRVQAADKLIDLLLRHFSYANYACRSPEVSDSIHEITLDIFKYISAHYTEKISISSFAESLHFSKTHIASLVKNYLNLTFNEALNYRRCFQAEHLLLTTDKTNLEISNECGFSDSKYFYTNFKKWYDRTPAQHKALYEELCKEKDDYNEIPPAQLKPFIKEYYCSYHSRKTIEYIMK